MARKAEFPSEFLSQCDSKFDCGRWGAATSNPFVTEQYLPKDLSDKIRAAVLKKYEEVKAKLDAAKGEVRKVGKDFVYAHECGLKGGAGRKESIFFEMPTEYVPINRWSGKPEGLHLLCVYHHYASRKNGVDRCTMAPLEKAIVSFSQGIDENNSYDISRSQTSYSICYSPSKGLYRLRAYTRVWTDEISDSQKRRNWCRGRKRAEFIGLCKNKFRALVDDGWRFSGIEHFDYNPNLMVFVKNSVDNANAI